MITMSGKEFVRRLMEDGWEVDRISGSHHIMVKGCKTVSVPVHDNRDLNPKVLNKLLKQAGSNEPPSAHHKKEES